MTYTEQSSFNFTESIEARDAGMKVAADNRTSLLDHARKIAVEIAKDKGVVTADDVQRRLERQGIDVHALGNAAGSLFRGKHWRWTGELRQSARVHAHGNLLRVWTLA